MMKVYGLSDLRTEHENLKVKLAGNSNELKQRLNESKKEYKEEEIIYSKLTEKGKCLHLN